MLSACDAPDVLQQLRAATQREHAELELCMPLMRHDLTLAGYADCLCRMWRIYAPLEAVLDAQCGNLARAGLMWSQRRKLHRLELDLRALAARGHAPASWPKPIAVRAATTPWAAWGYLYVVEGATLGGQIIRKHLEHTIAVNPSDGGSFFFGYGGRTGSLWRQYLSALQRAVVRPEHVQETVLAARQLFRLFYRCMSAKEL